MDATILGPPTLEPRLAPDCFRKGGWRLAAMCFFAHGIYGCFLPYLYLFFSNSLHFSSAQVGVLASLVSLMRIVSPPIWGAASDAVRRPRLLIAGALIPSLTALVLMVGVPEFYGIVALMTVFAFFFCPAVPMVDGATFKYTERTGGDYARVRLWGSVGFIVCAAGLGIPMYFWPDVRWFFALAVPMGALACYAAVRIPDCPARQRGKVGLRGFVMFKRFPVAVITFCSLLSWASMSAYYTFFSQYLTGQEVALYWIGTIWSVGTLSETFVMYHTRWILDRIGVKGMFAAGVGGVVLRLGLLSLLPPWPIVMASQVLHALTFTCVHVSGVSYINSESPDHLRSSAQGIFSMIGPGLGMGLGSILAGCLRGRFDDVTMFRAHAAMALFALIVLLAFFHTRSRGRAGQPDRAKT